MMSSLIRLAAIKNGSVGTLRLTRSWPVSSSLLLLSSSSFTYNSSIITQQQQPLQICNYFSTASSTERFRNNNNRHEASSSSTTTSHKRNVKGRRSSWWLLLNNYQRFYERYKLWIMIIGALTIGSILKVVYFKFSRQMIVSDANAKHAKNMEHLYEANQYAQWSEQDRKSKLPSLTLEQRQQIQQYLAIIEQHGLTKSIAAATKQNGSQQEGGDDVGNSNNDIANQKCPILSMNHSDNNKTPTATATTSINTTK